jgi:ribulose-5-phosphate 4-epimerase/fuculose-1-phosphate aldolase
MGQHVSESERQARIDLAAAYRLAAHLGWEYLIYNHIALRVPGEPALLVKPHGLLFTEVQASNLMKLPLKGAAMDFAQNVNTAAFVIHTAILNARPEVNCTLHVHTVPGMAMSASKKGLLPLTQNAMRFYNRLSYCDFAGYETETNEAERLVRSLGPKNMAMILRNHGLLSCGKSAYEAVSTMWALVMCCETQLMLEASGAEIDIPSPEICERTARQYEGMIDQIAPDARAAYMRIVEQIDPSYKV